MKKHKPISKTTSPSFPKLKKGHVIKDAEEKIKNTHKPSIFIGSSTLAIPIGETVKKMFNIDTFHINNWSDGIFGETKSSGGRTSNLEWLKNFSDIYDFGIFIFHPDDTLSGKVNKETKKKMKVQSPRHNVIFEFGLFLGRLGIKRCFILQDVKSDEFINNYFTDLTENINDTIEQNELEFKLELYKYSNDPKSKLTLKRQVETIQKQILSNFEELSIGFLPATALAFGYFHNFVEVLMTTVDGILDKKSGFYVIDKNSVNEKNNLNDLIIQLNKITLFITIPSNIADSDEKKRKVRFSKSEFKPLIFKEHGDGRQREAFVLTNSCEENSSELIIYDIPTTLRSSIEAINLTNQNKQIRLLLEVKEIRNFEKTLGKIITDKARELQLTKVKFEVKFIPLSEFDIKFNMR